MKLIKVGGNELDEPGFVERLARIIAASSDPTAVVHGGGKAIGELQQKLGITTRKVDGLRVTDEASLAVAQMVLSGMVNKQLVQALVRCGVQALGLSGVDAGLLRCTRKQYGAHDLGLVGEIAHVNQEALARLTGSGFTLVISPISLGVDGAVYNVNADEAAGAVASALRASRAWFISNVPAVLDDENRPIETLYQHEALALIDSGAVRNGMVPKVRAALKVLSSGVDEVVITDIDGLEKGAGTRFIRSEA